MAKILAIDDKQDNLITISALLKNFIPGCSVITADSGVKGIEMAKTGRPDTILLDIKMPGMDGFEVCETLKSDEKTKHIPIIMVTAIKTDAKSRIKSLECGADAFLAKPIDEAEITAQLNVMLRIKKTEDDLRREKDALERRVAARTRELVDKNKQLKTEIEERKRTERNLKEAYQIISNSSSVAFTWKNTEGWPVEFVSDNVQKIFGWSAGDFLSNKVVYSNCIHPDDIERVGDEVLKAGNDQAVKDFDHAPYRILTKDGKEKLVHDWTYIVRNRRGKATHFKGLIEDITGRARAKAQKKALEARLRQSQKMEAIGALAGGIAHDFNNILSAVIGYTEVVLDDMEEGKANPDTIREVLAAGLRARDLVQQILAFSRQDEKKPRPILISPLVKETLNLLRATLPSTIEIKRVIKGEHQILADPTQIHQVLMNLCANAAHSMRNNGGALRVELDSVEMGPEAATTHPEMKPGPYVKLMVSDTGHGMSGDVINRIMEPFFTTKKKGDGSGMGLSVVHGIVASHGGVLDVFSEPGKGSTFTALFPAIKKSVERDVLVDEPYPRGDEHILFVDDEPPIVETSEKILRSLGYKVTSLTNGVDAYDLFKRKGDEFDLVITDLTMPHMTGERLARKILALKPEFPVILCTGFSTITTPEAIKAMGVRAYLLKPLLKRELAKTIREALDA